MLQRTTPYVTQLQSFGEPSSRLGKRSLAPSTSDAKWLLSFVSEKRDAVVRPTRGSIMRRIRYEVAASLDGYIAGPSGEFDWIVADPDVDFAELFDQFDTFLMGRGTFETMVRQQGTGAVPGKKVIVFSRTLKQKDHPEVTIVAEPSKTFLTALRNESGKDIWIFGGGLLFRSLLEMRMVDTVEIAVIPVLVGGGIPLLPPPAPLTKLKLTGHRVYKTGIVSLQYTIEYPEPR